MSPRRLYEEELKQLQESVEEMGMGVRATYARLFSALQQQKESVIEEIITSDQSTHTLQRRIEGSCLNLITKQQPIARDLRQVSASLKVVTDISRIGDQCSDIAELVKRMLRLFDQLCGKPQTVRLSAKSTRVKPLSIPDSAVTVWSVMLVGAVPALIAVSGLLVWRKRRNRA